MIGIFLAAFAIPVTFESIMWVRGPARSRTSSRSRRARSASPRRRTRSRSTPAATSPSNTAIAYSTAQQLITTAWNVVVALILVVLVFGWTGGKQLVGGSYGDAKVKLAEQKAQRAEKKAEKNAQHKGSGRRLFHREDHEV